MIQLKSQFAKTYFWLTQYLPRKRPQSKKDIESLFTILETSFGLEMSEEAKYAVLSQLTSGEPTSMRKSYASLIRAIERIHLAKLVGEQKGLVQKRLEARLEELVKIEAERAAKDGLKEDVTGSHSDHADLQDWTHSIKAGNVQTLQIAPQGMDEIPGGNGL